MVKRGMIVGLLSILISACIHTVSYYDALSYKNLTDLKAETNVFFENCRSELAPGNDTMVVINELVLTASRAYEYEKGKQLNDDSVAQLAIINDTIRDVKQRFLSSHIEDGKCIENAAGTFSTADTGCLRSGYCLAKQKVLETAFDIAISTERLKLSDND